MFSGARVAYPVSKRDIPSHAGNLRHFIGLRANELAPHCLIKMDEAGELQGAAEEVGMIPETSLSNRCMATQLRARARCPRGERVLQEHTPSIGFALLSAHAFLSLCMPLDVFRPTVHVRSDKDAMGSTHQGEVRWRPLLFRTARLESP